MLQPTAPPPIDDDLALVASVSRFDIWRGRLGFVLAPAVFLAVWLTDFEGLSGKPEAHRLASIVAAVIVLWICESLPMAVTALAGATACVVLRVAPAQEVFAPFADPLMFLFIGSFMLGRAIFLHDLDKRVAYTVLALPWVGARPGRLLFAFGGVTAFISAWISNTATTAMMFAIGLSLWEFIRANAQSGAGRINPRFATGLMLMTSFSASIGGLATPIGTPPNVMGIKFIRDNVKVDITFFEWATLGAPVVIVLFLFLWAYLNWFCSAGTDSIPGCGEMLTKRRRELGPWTTGQISTVIAFLFAVTLWVVPGVIAIVFGEGNDSAQTVKLFGKSVNIYEEFKSRMPEGVVAIAAAILLFLLPGGKGRRALKWSEAVQIDWGVVLLYGGGFAFGVLANKTGLTDAVGNGLIEWMPASTSELGLLIATTLFAVLVSEATSNTASATIVVPLAIKLAQSLGMDPILPALGATFGASLGFMLPVSTPCNAIVYGSGLIPMTKMIRYGFLLDVVGVVVIVTLVSILGPTIR